MAFPYTTEKDFELGSTGEFDSETDGNGVLSVMHARQIAGINRLALLPYRGAYALGVNLVGADTNQYLQEDDNFDIAANATLYIRIVFGISTDLVMAASDRFTLLALQSSGPTDEAVIDIRNNSGVIEVLASETGASATVAAGALTLGVHHTVELYVNLDDGGGDDGTLDFYLDGQQQGSQLTGLDQGAIIQGRLGAIGVDAGTTAGFITISEITADDGRLYPYDDRYANPRIFTKSGSLFQGPGSVNYATFLSTGADNILQLYDTADAGKWATAGTPDQGQGYLLELDPDANKYDDRPIAFKRGCYVYLQGTNPRAVVGWPANYGTDEHAGPLAVEEGTLRNHLLR